MSLAKQLLKVVNPVLGGLPRSEVKWTPLRREIYHLLTNMDNRGLSNKHIGEHLNAKNPSSDVYKAFQDERFAAGLKSEFGFHTEMSSPERKVFALARQMATEDSHTVSAAVLLRQARITPQQGYPLLKRPMLVAALNDVGITINYTHNSYPPHENITYIVGANARRQYMMSTDVLDFRRVCQTYPLQLPPSAFVLDLTPISTSRFRRAVGQYLYDRLIELEPQSAAKLGTHLRVLFLMLEKMYPEVISLSQIKRRPHIQAIISALSGGRRKLQTTLIAGRALFDHARMSGWQDMATTGLIIDRDIPRYRRPDARPLDGAALATLDDYLISTVIPCLEAGTPPNLIDAEEWDFLLIMRHSGRRHDDLMGLLVTEQGDDNHCLKTDRDGDQQLYIAGKFSKSHKDILVPLAHLDDYTKYGNVVVRAVRRQMERVKERPPCKDGRNYLFRIPNEDHSLFSKLPSLSRFNNTTIQAICRGIPLRSLDDTSYQFSANQLRHTVATEMVNAGVDIYAVMSFMGHSRIAVTERYVRLLRAELKRQLALAPLADIYRPRWTKPMHEAEFELEDGVCGHPWKIPSCPARSSKTCVRKKAFARHVNGIEKNIRIYTSYANHATEVGEDKAAAAFLKVVDFNVAALDAIRVKGIFIAAVDYYGRQSG